jgi:hypothetical protein
MDRHLSTIVSETPEVDGDAIIAKRAQCTEVHLLPDGRLRVVLQAGAKMSREIAHVLQLVVGK